MGARTKGIRLREGLVNVIADETVDGIGKVLKRCLVVWVGGSFVVGHLGTFYTAGCHTSQWVSPKRV